MTDSNQKPLTPNYVNDVGRLVTDRFDFQQHINGTGFRQAANTVDMVPLVTMPDTSQPATVQDAIAKLAALTSAPSVPQATVGISTSNLGVITLGGDVGNTGLQPRVVGIQGRPVSPIAPSNGYVLTWNGSQWVPQTPSISPLGNDLQGNTAVAIVIGLQNRPLAATAPSNTQVISWNGATWTPSNVSQIQGNTVTPGALTVGQLLLATTTTNWSHMTITGDVSSSNIMPGRFTIVGIQGTPVSSTPPTSGQFLRYNGTNWIPTTVTNPADNLSNTIFAAGADWTFNAGAFDWFNTQTFFPLVGGFGSNSVTFTIANGQKVSVFVNLNFFNTATTGTPGTPAVPPDAAIVATIVRDAGGSSVDLYGTFVGDWNFTNTYGSLNTDLSLTAGGLAYGTICMSFQETCTLGSFPALNPGTHTYTPEVSVIQNAFGNPNNVIFSNIQIWATVTNV